MSCRRFATSFVLFSEFLPQNRRVAFTYLLPGVRLATLNDA